MTKKDQKGNVYSIHEKAQIHQIMGIIHSSKVIAAVLLSFFYEMDQLEKKNTLMIQKFHLCTLSHGSYINPVSQVSAPL